MKEYKEIIVDILEELDKATLRGIRCIKEYLKEHGGIIDIDDSGDKMYAIVFNYDMGANVETKIKGLRLDINEEDSDGELEMLLDYPYNEWVSLYDDIYCLPTVQSILEAIDQYE